MNAQGVMTNIISSNKTTSCIATLNPLFSSGETGIGRRH